MPLTSIVPFSAMLREHLDMRAALAGGAARLYLNQFDDGGWEIGHDEQGVLSVAISLESVWQAVYQFIGVAAPVQRELALGLMSLPFPGAGEDRRGRVVR